MFSVRIPLQGPAFDWLLGKQGVFPNLFCRRTEKSFCCQLQTDKDFPRIPRGIPQEPTSPPPPSGLWIPWLTTPCGSGPLLWKTYQFKLFYLDAWNRKLSHKLLRDKTHATSQVHVRNFNSSVILGKHCCERIICTGKEHKGK